MGKVKVIFARAVDRIGRNAFGYKGGLPWPHCKDDMKFFTESTKNSVIIMGKKTWESLPKRLAGRVNVVMCNWMPDNRNGEVPDVIMHGSIGNAIEELKANYPEQDICIIGGISIIAEALDFADEVHMSTICMTTNSVNTLEADTFIDPSILVKIYSIFKTEKSTVVNYHANSNDNFVSISQFIFTRKVK